MDGCFGCVQKILAEDEQKKQTIKVAQRTADETGEWWGIYQEAGTWFAIPSSFQNKYPIQQHFSPQLQHVNA